MSGTITVQNIQGPTTGSNANQVLVPSGHTLHSPGHVLQVQQYQAYPAYMNLSSDSFAATNIAVTITPKFATSKIVLHASWGYWFASDSNNYCIGTFYRGSSNLGTGGYSALSFHGPLRNSSYNNHATMDYIDSPATTNATTYTVYVRPYSANTSHLRVQWSSQLSFLSATEIAQ